MLIDVNDDKLALRPDDADISGDSNGCVVVDPGDYHGPYPTSACMKA